MAKYAPGTLVRVRDNALGDWINANWVRQYGYLYLVESRTNRLDSGDQGYWCRSIATGEGALFWGEDEIEGAEDHE